MSENSTSTVAFRWLAAVPETSEGERTPGFAKVQDYLERFGYLERPVGARGELDDGTHEALLSFQRFWRLPETGVFDDATREVMMRPRCALPDNPRAAGIEFATTCAWERTDLTYALDTGTDDVAGTAEFDAIRRAFASWQAIGPMTFREVAVGANPDIRVGWRPAADPDHSMVGGVLAHADFPPRCGVVTNTLPKPVHFDDTEHLWSIGALANAFDIETVALHEIGHIVGLAHSSVPGAVMLPSVSPNFVKTTLTRDDIDGFRALYPARPSAWSTWSSQGGVITSNIAVGRNADGRLEMFARGTDNALWHKWQVAPNGTWSGWASLGGVITSDPAVGSNADGRLEVFARGTDGAVWHRWQTAPNSGWAGWASRGGVITSNITIGRNADGRLEVFARGTDNALWHFWQVAPNSTWSGWESLGGVLTSNITVGRNADGRMEVFVRGTDNAMWHKWQVAPNSTWSGWASRGGVLTSDITVGNNADGRMEVFVRGTDNAMWHMWQVAPNSTWSGWASRGGVLTSNIALGRNATGRLEPFVRGTDNALWHMWQTAPNNGWSGWASLGGILTSQITVAANADGRLEAFVRGTDGAVWHVWQNMPFLSSEMSEQAEIAETGPLSSAMAGDGMPVPSSDPRMAPMEAGAGMPIGAMATANAGSAPAAAHYTEDGTMPAGAMAGEVAGEVSGTTAGSSEEMPAGAMAGGSSIVMPEQSGGSRQRSGSRGKSKSGASARAESAAPA